MKINSVISIFKRSGGMPCAVAELNVRIACFDTVPCHAFHPINSPLLRPMGEKEGGGGGE